jgi:hypothetical protein
MDAAPDDYNGGDACDLLLEIPFYFGTDLALAGMKEM